MSWTWSIIMLVLSFSKTVLSAVAPSGVYIETSLAFVVFMLRVSSFSQNYASWPLLLLCLCHLVGLVVSFLIGYVLPLKSPLRWLLDIDSINVVVFSLSFSQCLLQVRELLLLSRESIAWTRGICLHPIFSRQLRLFHPWTGTSYRVNACWHLGALRWRLLNFGHRFARIDLRMWIRQVEAGIADYIIIIVVDSVLVVLHRLIVAELLIELVQSSVHLSLMWHRVTLCFRAHNAVWTYIGVVLNSWRWRS